MTGLAFALVSTLWLAQVPTPAAATVQGTTVDAGTAAPIPNAQVTIVELARAVRTGGDGRFVFERVPPGDYTLTVSIIGYVFVRRPITVTPGGVLQLTVPLSEGAGAYQETVRVTPPPEASAEPGVSAQAELGSASLQDLRSIAADDPMRAVQALPGVATGDDFQSQFSVRGSEFRHVGVVFDGTATPLLLHTVRSTNDTASIAMINTDVLDRASLLAGAYPQRHGDWLGATLDFGLREGSRDRVRFRAAASATTASFVGEGPLGRGKRGAWLASIRRSYIDWLVRKVYPSIDATLGFTDAQSKFTYDLSPRQQIQLLAIAGDAGFRHDSASLANGIRRAKSQTALGSAVWRYARHSWLASQRVSFVASRFTDRGRADQQLGRGYGRSLLWRGDASWFLTSGWTVEAGARSEWQHQTITENHFVVAAGLPQLATAASSHNDTGLASAWAQVVRRTTIGGGSIGARVTRDTLSGRTVVSPWLLGERTLGPVRLRGSAGISHQFPELELQRGLPERIPERAEMVDGGLGGGLGHGLYWQATAFWRHETNVIRRSGEDRLVARALERESIFPLFASSLDGRTHGVDVAAGRRAAIGVTGWVSYTYSRTRDHDRITQEDFDGDYDQRHTVNVFLQDRVSYRTAVSAKLRLGSNVPIAGYFEGPVERLRLGADRNTVRLPAYARLDVRANRTFTYDRRRLTLFLELVNVTGHDNLGQRPGLISGPDLDAVDYTEKLLPFLPSAGVLIEF
jgi:Carboxypeptidase regulatory-like domain/TonB-dependent Receptor Plug Domain